MQFGDESLIKDRIDQLKKLSKMKDADTRELHHLQLIIEEKGHYRAMLVLSYVFEHFLKMSPDSASIVIIHPITY